MTADGGLPASRVDPLRVRAANELAPRAGDYVLYWMIAARRTGWNFGLERAVEWAHHLGKPLVVLEALRCEYPWASDRLHRFVLDGMAENQRRLAGSSVLYHPYVEPEAGAGQGLLAALGAKAALVVSDEFPCFFLPRMVEAAAAVLPVRLEVVDSNGLVPLRATPGAFGTAFAFRRWLQAHLATHLDAFPRAAPLQDLELPALTRLPAEILRRWPRASAELLRGEPDALARLPIDHSVPVASTRGGSAQAELELERFLREGLPHYATLRNHPDERVTSGLSPYLHFGHVSAHQVFEAVTRMGSWSPGRMAERNDGRRGWLGLGDSAEAFMDQLITWRELGYAFNQHRADYDRYESLPDWARQTLESHARSEGPVYSARQLDRAETRDELWNAAQNELVREGRLHNYLRMLWGKKILEWSASPREALELLIHLNNRYALDGRNPNSYSGIFWCLGRFDRPWGPRRPAFGSVRYMSSTNTARKVRLDDYLERYGSLQTDADTLPLFSPEARPRRRPGRQGKGNG